MKQIDKLLRKYIKRSGYTIYGIAKTSGVNRSTLQKILLENRKPSRILIDRLMPFLNLSPEEESEILSIMEIMNTGETLYHQRLYIRKLLEHTSYTLCGSYADTTLPPSDADITNGEPYQKSQFFHGQPAVENLIHKWIKQECLKAAPQVQIHLPGDSVLLHSILLHTMHGCPDYQKLTIRHLTYFFKIKNSNKLAAENLKILYNIIPFIANTTLNYHAYYYYHDTYFMTQHILTAFTYYITGSGWSILLSSDYTTALFFDSPDTSLYLNELFDTELLQARPLAAVCTNPESISPIHIQASSADFGYAFLEFQPCLAPYLTDDLIRRYIRKDIKTREQMISRVLSLCQQLRSLTQCTHTFSKDGLRYFTETGHVTYLPDNCAHPFSPEDRIYLLRQLYQDVEGGTWNYFMADSQIISVSDTFSFAVMESKGLTFTGFDEHIRSYKYIFIEEQTLINAFYDYITYLIQTPFICSKEVTLDFIQQCIRSLQHKP